MTVRGIERADPDASLSTAEIDALAGQLRQLAAEGRGIPRLPLPILSALRSLAPVVVVELCIVDAQRAVLLTWRDDEHWRGWHFPGGFMGPRESLAEACSRVAQRELGAAFALSGVVGVESWPSHPFASPVALLCRGTLDRAPSDGRYFADPPDDLIAEQRTYFASLRAGGLVAADRMRA
jgi:hypothetical protein